MNFPFTYEITIGGACIAQIDGTLVLEVDPDSRTPCGSYPDWTVKHIVLSGAVLSGSTVRATEVVLPDTHGMHDPILAGALGRYRHDIDRAWADHRRADRFEAEGPTFVQQLARAFAPS